MLKKIIIILAAISIFFITILNGVNEVWQSYFFVMLIFMDFVLFALYQLKRDTFNKFAISKEFLIFILVFALLPLFSYYRYISVLDAYIIIASAVLFFILSSTIEKKDTKFILYSVVLLGLIVSSVGYVGYVAVAKFPSSYIARYTTSHSFISGKRLNSFFQYPNSFGGFLLLPAFLSLGMFFNEEKKNIKFALYLVSVFLVFILYLTGSRGAEIVFVIGIILLFVFATNKQKKKELIELSGVAFGVILAVYLNNHFLAPIVQYNASRVKHLVHFLAGEENRSLSDRIQLAKDAANIFIHHPIFGTGLGTFRDAMLKYRVGLFYARFPHSSLFRFLAETGIVGTTTFFFIVVEFFIKSINKLKANRNFVYIGLLTGTVTFFLHTLLDLDFAYPVTFAVLFAALALLLYDEKITFVFSLKSNLLKITSITLIVFIILSLVPKSIASMYGEAGDVALDNKNFSQAVSDYRVAMKIEPSFALYHGHMAEAFGNIAFRESNQCKDNLSKALNEYEIAYKLNPFGFMYPLCISEIYLLSKNKDAVHFAEESFNDNPQWKPLLSDVALSYAYTGENDNKAIRLAREALRFSTDEGTYKALHYTTPKKKNSTAYTAMGFVYLHNNAVISNGYFEKAIQLDPANVFAYLGLSKAFGEEGNKMLQIENLFKAVGINPCLKEAHIDYFNSAPLINIKTDIAKVNLKANSPVTLNFVITNNKDILSKIDVSIVTDKEITIATVNPNERNIKFTLPIVDGKFRILLKGVDKNGVTVSRTLSSYLSESG